MLTARRVITDVPTTRFSSTTDCMWSITARQRLTGANCVPEKKCNAVVGPQSFAGRTFSRSPALNDSLHAPCYYASGCSPFTSAHFGRFGAGRLRPSELPWWEAGYSHGVHW